MTKCERIAANSKKMKIEGEKKKILEVIGDDLLQKVKKKQGKPEKEMTKWERFAANAKKMKIEGDKKKILGVIGDDLLQKVK